MNWKWPKQLELAQPVGEGWLGVIYLARDQDSPRQVYTRLLSAEARASLEALSALLQLHATSPHPHILPTTLPEVSGGETFYSMQPAERGSLRTLVKHYQASGQLLDPLTALDLIRQVGEALSFAHAQRTFHGNLKPENVLLQPGRALLGREGFHVLLSDFGLNALRPPGGSAYLSARQRRGEPGDVPGDLYGLGALLFFALSGEDPPPVPTPEALERLALAQRSLVARALGLLTPFADVPAFLGALSRQLPGARQLPGSGSLPTVTLRAEEERLQLVPGEAHLTRVRLSTQTPLSAALLVEGLPPEWVRLPPAVQLQGGQEVTLPLTLQVPRSPEARSGERRLRLLLVRGQPGGAGPGELLAEQTLEAEVAPFHAHKLALHAPPQPVGRHARLELDLTNLGNRTRRYDLRAQLPPGGRLPWPLPAPVILAPGERARVQVPVRLAPGLLRGRRQDVSVTAQELEEEGSASGPVLRAAATLRQRPAVPAWGAAALLAALALGGWQAGRVPSIGAFTAEARSGEVPTRGEPFTLSWETAGAREVRIRELPGRVLGSSGALELPAPAGATTYTLEARGWLRSAQRPLTVRPRPPAPGITALSVTPPTVSYGEAVTVRWEVQDAPQGLALELSPLGEVPARGERTLPLTRDTTFILTVPGRAAGEERRARASATLRPPAITRLSVMPGQAKPGQSVTVQWQVSGARLVRLGALGTLPAEGRRTLTVPADARPALRYVLKASNGQTEVSAAAEVKVALPQPVITAFRAVPATPVIGEPVKVFWRTTGADGVELRWAGGRQRLPARGLLTLTATAELRELGLLAQAEGGSSAERRLTLAPQSPPPMAAVPPTPRSAVPAPTAPAVQASSPRTPERQTTTAPPVARAPEGPALARPAPAKAEPATPPAAAPPRVPATSPREAARRPSTSASSAPPPAAPPSAIPTSPGPTSPAPVPTGTRTLAPERPVPAVKVLGFRSETAAPRVGEPLTVRWNVRGAKQVALLNAEGRRIGLYPAQGTATLRPREAGALRLLLGMPGKPGPLTSLSLTVGRREVASRSPVLPAPHTSPQTAAATVAIREFRAAPAQVQPGQATTLVWRVTGAKQVFVPGLSGPNPGGSFPPAYAVLTPRLERSATYTLRAGDERQTVQVAVSPAPAPPAAAPTPPSSAPRAAPTAPAGSPYQALRGTWSHSLGLLTVEVAGHRLTGTLYSSEETLPGGALQGTLQGPPESATFSGYLSSGGKRVAVVLRFTGSAAFNGVYASERRHTWCGWRGTARSGC